MTVNDIHPLHRVFDIFNAEGASIDRQVPGADDRLIEAVAEQGYVRIPADAAEGFPEDARYIRIGVHPHNLNVGESTLMREQIVVVRTA